MKRSLLALIFILPVFTACTYEKFEPTPECPEAISLEIASQENTACGLETGKVEVGLTGNAASSTTAEFSLNEGTFQSAGLFEGLAAGTYTILARDGACEAEISVTIQNEDGLNAALQTEPSDCSTPTGSIRVSTSNVQGQVSYALDNAPAQSDSLFANLAPGTYSVTVTDASGCELTLQTEVSSDASYAAVEAIINSSCASPGCHGGSVAPDLRNKQTIISRSGRILARTSAGTMPPGGRLSADKISDIQCWVDAGTPE
ncbi:MAG: hypothetical protein AAGI38_19875 [Bacteroidota bacterium]